jgi:MoCo/4Fe-4S cofactor protein with predicted Tat translocation signal
MSKRVLQHPEESGTGKRYWRSLGQLRDTPEFRNWLQREFPQGASELESGDVSRRSFLQLMGASVALAGLSLSACRRPLKTLVPFSKGAEWSVPGKALFFSSSMPARGGAIPLRVTTFDGRPTKIEGNPLHPVGGGATDVWAQSSILDLYDPQRSKGFLLNGKHASAEQFHEAFSALVGNLKDGSNLAVLTDGTISPTRERLRKQIMQKYPLTKWASYEPLGGDLEAESVSVAFGSGRRLIPKLDKADVVLTIDRDILGVEGDLAGVRDFASRRRVEDSASAKNRMNRLYVVENRFTLTGGMSDHRLRLPAGRASSFLKALALELSQRLGAPALGKLASELKASSFASIPDAWVRECAADLVSHKGKSIVLVGQHQPVAVQLLGHAVNEAIGAIGLTVEVHSNQIDAGSSLLGLSEDLRKGKRELLLILGGNPVYNAPADARWSEAQASAKTVVHLSHEANETSIRGGSPSTWHVPAAHYLEQWGDSLASDGSYVTVQPVILPLYGGLSDLELLSRISGDSSDVLSLVKGTFRIVGGFSQESGESEKMWVETLRQGFLKGSASKSETSSLLDSEGVRKVIADSPSIIFPDGSLEVCFVRDSKVDDGRYANNGWLQELPDPISKLTWDNAALISPNTAKRLGVSSGDVLKLTVGDKSVEIACLESPGHADDSLSVAVGYGRQAVGSVGREVGVDIYPLIATENRRFKVGAVVSKAGRSHALAVTQEHGALEGRGADITRQATVEEWLKNAESKSPTFFNKMGIDAHAPENFSLYTNPPLDDVHAWGMVVDLNTCTGCSACMLACQAENNIPIVGKEQVIGGREMHWIRTDRYFASAVGGEADPEMVSQPMMCQHCENAPCETVCPVNATVHSEDGINVMAYNRCIGTRYCANNCPFKVRRFNFFDYNQRDIKSLYKWNLLSEKGMPEAFKLQKNPNVTVRMRGVMEKCTFCIQRVQEAKIAAKVLSRDSGEVPRVPADAFTTACAQVCPTSAITFGDLRNKDSSVVRLKDSHRSYRLLEYLNTQNRVWYMARIRNPNPRMPDAGRAGSASREEFSSHFKGEVEHL